VLFVVGLLALILQGALARVLPPPWCPDLSWLVVVALGLRWPGLVSGMLVATLLGFSMDLLSGSLMGQHALLRVLSFLAAAVATRQLDLSGSLPISLFVFALMFGYGLAVVATLAFFVGSAGIDLQVVGRALIHALVNAAVAPSVLSGIERLISRLSEEEIGRRAWPLGIVRGNA